MSLHKSIDNVIEEILVKYNQPFIGEFKTYIKHILSDSDSDDELLERITAIKIVEL